MNRLSIDGTKTKEQYRLYLDVDGVILGGLDPAGKGKVLARSVFEFLYLATRRFEVYWLTPHCHGDTAQVLDYIRRYHNRDVIEYLLKKIKPTAFTMPRTNLFGEGEEFYWVTADASREDVEWMESRALFNNLIQVDTRKDPDGLIKVRDFLREELRRDE